MSLEIFSRPRNINAFSCWIVQSLWTLKWQHIPVKSYRIYVTFLDFQKSKFFSSLQIQRYTRNDMMTGNLGTSECQYCVCVCVFRTQQPSVESAVEGHVSSQNHMQSCWQDPNHVRASGLKTTVQTKIFVSLNLTHTHIYIHICAYSYKQTHTLFPSPDTSRNVLRWRI